MKKLLNIYLYFKLTSFKNIILDLIKFIFRTSTYTIIFLVAFCSLMLSIGYNSDVLYLQKENHKIVLIGTVHLSPDKNYYKNISTLNEIYKLEDYQLYYEMVKDNPKASNDTHKTKQALSETFSFLADKAKLKQQHDYLYYNIEDKNADIDFLQLEKLGGIKEIKKFTGFNELFKTTNTNVEQQKKNCFN